MNSSWAFYNSDGKIVGGFDGAWKFYDAEGLVQAILSSTPAAHASTHEDGGSDEVTIENLPTAETDTDLVLKPDGAGGVVFGAGGGGGSIAVEEADGNPSVSPVDTIIFDQGDGFVVTDNADGSVTITFTGAGGDASTITFAPAVLADWDGSADPGNVDDALDQLAERIADLEAGGGGGGAGESFHPFMLMGA